LKKKRPVCFQTQLLSWRNVSTQKKNKRRGP
jgi:hypothetical protein